MKRTELEAKAKYVRHGGDLVKLTNREVIALQEFALDIKDIDLYDELQKFWGLKNFTL